MVYHRTISSDAHREEVFKKLIEYTPGISFSEILGELAEEHLKKEHGIITNPNIDDDFADWQAYSLDCNAEEFNKLINFNTRLTNTIKRHEGKIRK